MGHDLFSIGILLFHDVEVLDFAGPYEVFSCARNEENAPYFQLATVTEQNPVMCRGGLTVTSQYTFDNAPHFDVLIIPGGPGARAVPSPALDTYVRKVSDSGCILATVCTGAYILAHLGLLDGKQATTHTAWQADLAHRFSEITVVSDKIVDAGRIITAGGVTTGIELGLHLLERYFGSEARRREAIRLDGPFV
ncbi:DJ-1/PfpI family protein [Desulfovibrio inopinatus]|uniref:DJ-1/PfpI family protein n=1 Tax=Desulfovibrio inopinatus TaxID=102109 RepID=UPI0004184497|nr:DJ-1/PfpI family protein [Desulfovibrio inopinatus]